jgi:hypothetical protein
VNDKKKSTGFEDEAGDEELETKRPKKGEITLEALEAAGYKGGPSVLLTRRPPAQEEQQAWDWCVLDSNMHAAVCGVATRQHCSSPLPLHYAGPEVAIKTRRRRPKRWAQPRVPCKHSFIHSFI